jgi:hypothetical protein
MGDYGCSEMDRDWTPMAPHMMRALFLEGTDNGTFIAPIYNRVSSGHWPTIERFQVKTGGLQLKLADCSGGCGPPFRNTEIEPVPFLLTSCSTSITIAAIIPQLLMHRMAKVIKIQATKFMAVAVNKSNRRSGRVNIKKNRCTKLKRAVWVNR